MSKSYYRQIPLAPLSSEAIAEMLEDLLGADPSLDGLPELRQRAHRRQPVLHRGGVQLLVEAGNLEGERGAYRLVRPVEESVVPASVQAVLAARIDRLPEREKAVLQAASVIGKEFPQPVLDPVAGLDPNELEEALRGLVSAGFVYEQEIYPEAVFAFKHPLTQEVAYGSQLGGRRASAHAAARGRSRASTPRRPTSAPPCSPITGSRPGRRSRPPARTPARPSGPGRRTRPRRSATGAGRRARRRPSGGRRDPRPAPPARMFMLQFAWRVGISAEEADALFREGEEIAAKSGDLHSRPSCSRLRRRPRDHAGSCAGMAEPRSGPLTRRGIRRPRLYITSRGLLRLPLPETTRAVAILDRALELTAATRRWAPGSPRLPVRIRPDLQRRDSLQRRATRGRPAADRPGDRDVGEFDDLETIGWGHMWHSWNAYWAGEPDGS